MKRILALVAIVIIIFSLSVKCFSQESITNTNSPERAATGQTKWMQSQLKFDQQIYSSVYNINLKYQVKIDSIHSSSIIIDEKRKLYQITLKKKNDELRRVMSKQMFDQYQIMIQTSRNPGKK